MAITQVSHLDQTVVAKYESDYLIWAEKTAVWDQVVDWQDPIPQDGGGGSSFDWPVYHELAPATTALTETDDVTAVALVDSNVTLTPTEYGNATTVTRKLRYQSRVDIPEVVGKTVGQNQAHTMDRLIRNTVVGGSWVKRPSGVARTALGTSDHDVSFEFISELVAQARTAFVEPFDGNMYLSIVHPLLARDIMALNEFKYPAYYQNQMVGGLLKAEIGALGGVRFIEHPYGKLYLAGGLTAQAATTLDGSIAAGATTLKAAASDGLGVGSYVLLGTKEASDAELVEITAQSGVSNTFQGIGNSFGTFGCQYSHNTGAAVTEAKNVGALPIIGRQSIRGAFGANVGRRGQATVFNSLDTNDKLGRFQHAGWYWYGGFARLEKYLIRGEVYVTGNIIGQNE